jgi:hypothetical protein
MFFKKEEAPEYIPGNTYTGREMELIADDMLKADSKAELCRECGTSGGRTGELKHTEQGLEDGSGNTLHIDFPELECDNGHKWFEGEGKAKGIGGDYPILFEEHFASRKRREIYTSIGTPDPSIQQGMYYRTHPQGRKVNSKEQRKKNGASYYR